MTWTIPGGLGLIPRDLASHVRADGGPQDHRALLITEGSGPLAVHIEHLTFAAPQDAHGGALCRGKAVPNDVVEVVLVLLEIVPGAAAQLGPVDGKDIAPRVGPAEGRIACHHP